MNSEKEPTVSNTISARHAVSLTGKRCLTPAPMAFALSPFKTVGFGSASTGCARHRRCPCEGGGNFFALSGRSLTRRRTRNSSGSCGRNNRISEPAGNACPNQQRSITQHGDTHTRFLRILKRTCVQTHMRLQLFRSVTVRF